MIENSGFLANLAAIEISTEIVEEITDEVFIPWEAYQAIYRISRSALENSAVHLSLRDRFLQLRRQLELTHALLLIDPSLQLYNRATVHDLTHNLTALADKNTRDWENIPTRLPSPTSVAQTNRLLRDRRFLDTLHRLNRARLNLERRERCLQRDSSPTEIVDRVYAQTLIQLDGEIVNRYDRGIFQCSERENLLALHRRSVAAGQKQWRELLNFVLSFCRPNK
ncbi:hypothetical protein [Myxosarcina sp. GI1(2024)]